MSAKRRPDARIEESPLSLQKLLLEAQEIARLGSWSWDVATGGLSFSSSLLTILDLPGHGCESFSQYLSHLHPEDRERTEKARLEALYSGAPGYTLEYRVLGEEGVTHVLARARIERDQNGLPVRVYGSLQDISERKQMEETLELERSFLDGLFENDPDAVVVTDDRGFVQKANRAFAALFGYSSEEVSGHPIDELVVPERLMDEGAQFTSDLGKGIRLDFVSTRRRRDGTEFPCRGLGVPVPLKNGQVGVYCIYRDLTREKEQQCRLGQALQVVEKSPVVLFRWTARKDWPIEYVSENVRLWGYDPETLMEKQVPYGSLVHPEDRGLVYAVTDMPDRQGNPEYVMEYRLFTASGETIWVEERSRLVSGSAGQPGSYQGTVTEVTGRKVAELALEKQFKEMERAWEQTIEALASTTEVKDPYTAGHQRRVAALSAAISRAMGYPETFVTGVEKAALVHDLGKIEVPAELLSRPGKLSPFEFRLVQVHAEAGYRILSKILLPWPLAEIVYQHHERLDGSGYPRGLRGGEILPEARIIAVADIVEAICSHRPYRPARTLDEALATVEQMKGTALDESVVETCLEIFASGSFSFPA